MRCENGGWSVVPEQESSNTLEGMALLLLTLCALRHQRSALSTYRSIPKGMILCGVGNAFQCLARLRFIAILPPNSSFGGSVTPGFFRFASASMKAHHAKVMFCRPRLPMARTVWPLILTKKNHDVVIAVRLNPIALRNLRLLCHSQRRRTEGYFSILNRNNAPLLIDLYALDTSESLHPGLRTQDDSVRHCPLQP